MRPTGKPHVDSSKRDRERPAALAKGGGARRMFGEQAAGPIRPGQTGKAQNPAPGAKGPRGGGKTGADVGGLARPARPGSTGPR
jgi:hypothetical protein